jgi:hypothetical protein
MTWWTLPSFWLVWVLAKRWTAGAKGLTAGAAGRSAAARRDLATPLWEEKSSALGSMASRRRGGVLLEHVGGVYGVIWVERRERCSWREVDRQGRGLRFRSGELALRKAHGLFRLLARALQRDDEQCFRLLTRAGVATLCSDVIYVAYMFCRIVVFLSQPHFMSITPRAPSSPLSREAKVDHAEYLPKQEQ